MRALRLRLGYIVLLVATAGASGCLTTPRPWLGGSEELEFGRKFQELYERRWGELAGGRKVSFSGPTALVVTSTTGVVNWTVPGVGYQTRGSVNFPTPTVNAAGDTQFAVDVWTVIGDATSLTLEAWKGPYDDPAESGTLTVPVTLDPPRATELGEGRIYGIFQILDDLDAKKLFGPTFAKSFFAIRVRVTNDFNFPVRVDAASIELNVFYAMKQQPGGSKTACLDDTDPMPEDGKCNLQELLRESVVVSVSNRDYLIWPGSRVPMNFTQVINTMKFNQRNDWRSITKDVLVGAGTLAAGATGFGSLSTGTYPLAVTYATGVGIPLVSEFLLRNLVENLAFLNATALHDSLTIGARSAAERFVFFPRGDIYGLWGMEQAARIMFVEEVEVGLKGAAILKQQTVESEE
jgi:hypothetical protein